MGNLTSIQTGTPKGTPFVDPIMDGWMGRELATYLFGEVRHPETGDEWATFFEHLLQAYDTVHDLTDNTVRVVVDGKRAPYVQPLVGAAVSKTITPEVRALIATLVSEGRPSPEIRAEVKATYDVDISASYMAHLRRRVKAVNL